MLQRSPPSLRRDSSIASTSGVKPFTPAQIKQKARDINLQGLEANKAGDTKVALSCFERAHELDPDEAMYLLSAANMTLKVEQTEGTSTRRRRSALMYLKVLEFPALTPRLAEKAQTKLEEARTAQDLDAELECGLGGWPGGVLIGETGDEVLGAAQADGTSETTAELTRRLQQNAALLLLFSLLFALSPQGLFGAIASCTVMCCCCCADQGPASNLGCARSTAWVSAVSASASAALCALGGIVLHVSVCPVAAEEESAAVVATTVVTVNSRRLGATLLADGLSGETGGGCMAWSALWPPPLVLALVLSALQLAHAYLALRTARCASALLPRVRLEILLH